MKDNLNMRKGGGRGGVIRLIMFVCVCFLALPGYVFAQDTPTPEPTSYSLFPTPTPISDYGACPVGTPLPTPLTLEYINNCPLCVPAYEFPVTPIAFGTFEVNPIGTITPGTPEPTVESTSTITPTPVPLTYTRAWYNLWLGELFLPEEYVSKARTGLVYYYSPHDQILIDGFDLSTNNSELHNSAVTHWIIDIDGVAPIGSSSYWSYSRDITLSLSNNSCTGNIYLDLNLDGIYEITVNQGSSYVLYQVVDNHNTLLQVHETLEFNLKLQSYCTVNRDALIDFYVGGMISNKQASMGAIYFEEEYIYTPEPTPTPTPNGYCNEYDYIGDEEDTLVDFGGIEIWQGACLVLIPNFSIDLPAVGEVIPAVNWGIDGFSICPKWVDLGTFEILEIEIPLDILALPAVVFLLLLIFNM